MTAEEKRESARDWLKSLYSDFSKLAFQPMDNIHKGYCVRSFLETMETLDEFFLDFKDDEIEE